ncbi:MAG: aminoacyl--tRNA ligase-related protein [Patescibacteria group bacterium]|jgi:prolyl-tRNA synthetase
MRYSQSFVKTNKNAKDLDSINATLLIKAGFVDQLMAGVYSYLPLGTRVLQKVEQIVREEMDKIAVEVLMPSLAPIAQWQQSGRFETVDVLMKTVPANKAAEQKHNASYVLNPTHEDIITPIAKKFNVSYRDLPTAAYQIQTKFRNEPRAKSGILRGREFRMKDLYSFHTTEADLMRYYKIVAEAYWKVYERLGLKEQTVYTYASGGDFTKEYSHEFQTFLESGEDTIYLDRKNNIAYNKEIVTDEDSKKLGVDFSKMEAVRASEVGNIFPLGTRFSDAFDYRFTDKDGTQKPVYMGCYGIGTSRIIGVIAEKFHDDKGLVWPKNVAPFTVHLVGLDLVTDNRQQTTGSIYDQLTKAGIEVFYDDRIDVSAGGKFTDADLIGIPYRAVVSKRTEGKIEFKKRDSKESSLVSLDEFLKLIS